MSFQRVEIRLRDGFADHQVAVFAEENDLSGSRVGAGHAVHAMQAEGGFAWILIPSSCRNKHGALSFEYA